MQAVERYTLAPTLDSPARVGTEQPNAPGMGRFLMPWKGHRCPTTTTSCGCGRGDHEKSLPSAHAASAGLTVLDKPAVGRCSKPLPRCPSPTRPASRSPPGGVTHATTVPAAPSDGYFRLWWVTTIASVTAPKSCDRDRRGVVRGPRATSRAVGRFDIRQVRRGLACLSPRRACDAGHDQDGPQDLIITHKGAGRWRHGKQRRMPRSPSMLRATS